MQKNIMTVFPCEGLHGEISLQGSKNSALPIMAAALANKGITVIENCPGIEDVYSMIQLLKECGCQVVFENNVLVIDAYNADNGLLISNNSRKLRASILIMGAALARFGVFSMAFPGGCAIGKRPIDFHIKGMEALGAECMCGEEIISGKAIALKGNVIKLPFPSVGATQNILIAATGADGVTEIVNASREPEIWDLCDYLRSLGNIIRGERTGYITIEPSHKASDVRYVLPADRIVAGTIMTAAAVTSGDVFINNIEAERLGVVMDYLKAVSGKDGTGVRIKHEARLKTSMVISTGPFPLFPTDMQSQFMALMSVSGCYGIIEENVFDTRFNIAEALNKLGANIRIENKYAYVNGVSCLHGGVVESTDLRGGAALVIAGLAAVEPVIVKHCEYIYRGYENIAGDLKKLGAVILEE